MERIETERLNLEEINQLLGLPVENDFSKYIDKYDNGVFRMDRNHDFTAYFSNSEITYIILISHNALYDYILNKKKEIPRPLKLYKTEFILEEKLNRARLEFKNEVIECYKIITYNVIPYELNDEESEMMDAWENEIEPPDNNPYDDIPYLGLPDDEQETGHWNID